MGDDRDQVAVIDFDLLVGQFLEGGEGAGQFVVVQVVAEPVHVDLEGVPAGELPENERLFGAGAGHADLRRVHDLPVFAHLEDAILVNARGVAEGVLADDGFVPLHLDARVALDHLARLPDFVGVDVRVEGQEVLARLDRHHHLFERGVARAFADAVDREFHLAGAILDGGQGVRRAEPEVILAVEAHAALVDVRHVFEDRAEEAAKFFRDGISNGVGDVDGRGPGVDAAFDDLKDEARVGAGRVHGAELDVARVLCGALDHRLGLGEDLLPVLSELVGHLDIRAVDEDVDARFFDAGDVQRFPGRVHVALNGAGEGADGRAFHRSRDGLNRFEVARG